MKISIRQLGISLVAFLLAVSVLIGFVRNPEIVGGQVLVVRALILNFSIFAALVAVFPLNTLFYGRPGIFGLFVCLPALLSVFIYFLVLLPRQSSGGVSGEQLSSEFITDASSNGIVEVGFAYPIYTPNVSLRNEGLYTQYVNVFLRMTGANGGEALFRGVRGRIPGTGLSVEASVQGMLSRNGNYLFNPVALPPARGIEGKVVFIISNLDDGTSFTDALSSATQAQFEVREPDTGTLIAVFPLDRI